MSFKVLVFCYGHPCIYESFCCHILICTIIVFDIANYCMSSDGKRLSGLKKKKGIEKKNKSQSSYLNFGEPAVCSPGGASASSSPHHCLQPLPAPAGKCQGIMGRRFWENPAWIAIVRCTVLNFSPYPFLLHNFKAMHGKVFFQKLVILVFFQFPDLDIPRLQSFPSQRDGIILRDLNYLLN